MSRIAKEYMEHQRKRWLRHDAWRFQKPSERVQVKFDPDQPRVPSGNPEGGQWTSSQDGGTQLAARISPQRQADCEEQYREDIFKCNLLGTRSCWEQAAFRKSQCLIGGYVPPLYF